MAGRDRRFLCLIAAGSATEICFWDLCCRFGGVWCGNGDRPGCWIVGEVSQSAGSVGFIHISLLLMIGLYGLVFYIYFK